LLFVVGAAVLAAGTLPAGRLPTGDAPHMLGMAARLANTLSAGDLAGAWSLLMTLVTPHPPIGYLVPTMGYLLGLGDAVPFVTALFALGLVWHGMCLLVQVPGGAANAPWAGGLFVLCSGMTWAMVDTVAWDLLAAGLVLATLGHMHASAGLSRPKHAVAVGLFAALGCMCKYTFPVFVLLPSLVVGGLAVWRRRWLGLALTLGVFAALAGPWLFDSMGEVLAYVSSSSDPSRTISASPASTWSERLGWRSLGYYPTTFRMAWGWPGLALLALCAPSLWHPGARLAGLGALGGIVALSQAGEQQARYMFAALPLLAVWVGVAVPRWPSGRRQRWRRWAFAGAVLPALWGAFATSWVHDDAPANRDLRLESLSAWGAWPWPAESFRPTNLAVEVFEVDRVIAQMAALAPPNTTTVGLSLPQSPGFPLASAYMWRAERAGHSWTWASVSTLGPSTKPAVFLSPSVGVKNRRFSVAYIVRQPGAAVGVVDAIAGAPAFRHRLPANRLGVVVPVAESAWQTAAGRSLLRDPMRR
jgi:hypothetical protein